MVLFTDELNRLIKGLQWEVAHHFCVGIMDDDGDTRISWSYLEGNTLVRFVGRIGFATLFVCFHGCDLIMVTYLGERRAHANGFSSFERWRRYPDLLYPGGLVVPHVACGENR